MRYLALIGLLAVCVWLSGCSSTGKKAAGTAGAPGKPAAPQVAPPPTSPPAGGNPGTPITNSMPANNNGILAGRVIDMSDRPRPATYIRVVLTPDGNKGAPVEQDVAADSQGFFMIQGLEAGRNYQLVARTQDGGRLIAGTAWDRPPNIRLLIHISEDYVTAATPPIPPAQSGRIIRPEALAAQGSTPHQEPSVRPALAASRSARPPPHHQPRSWVRRRARFRRSQRVWGRTSSRSMGQARGSPQHRPRTRRRPPHRQPPASLLATCRATRS